eukprot:CAMPEP_0172372172 /NCGR_PEP_ID=MMETSP1060-20121228/46279_1 /TAXON_ID=37318 /ORGANISM="Pseudo-nitzschia pungens, Strain cf. cingulata" /LENGTH=92 /DNA_ID=CAMNT_0013098039 /DNA_START=270 /DNA_END=548 /DNA_ORIENTATION=+
MDLQELVSLSDPGCGFDFVLGAAGAVRIEMPRRRPPNRSNVSNVLQTAFRDSHFQQPMGLPYGDILRQRFLGSKPDVIEGVKEDASETHDGM